MSLGLWVEANEPVIRLPKRGPAYMQLFYFVTPKVCPSVHISASGCIHSRQVGFEECCVSSDGFSQ